MARYRIVCRYCEDEYPARKVGDRFQCTFCGTLYEEDEGLVLFNLDEMEDQEKIYKGAKLAGYIPDPNLKGDREQRNRERW